MKNLSKKTLTIISTSLLSIMPLVASAQQITNPLRGVGSISGFVTIVLGYVVRIGGVVAIFAFIWTGYLFVKARGNPGELEKAKTVFINTCIGVAILLGASLIANIIVGTISSLR